MRKGRSERGYTLVELLVVFIVISVLVSIGVPVYVNMTNGSKDVAAQALLRDALITERLYHLENGAFTANRRELLTIKPAFEWNVNGNPPGSVRVRVRAAYADAEVCLFTVSESGVWFAVYHTPGETRYGRPDGLVACNPNRTRDWSTDGW